jgi:ribonuclease R
VGTLEHGPAGVRGRSRRRWLVPFDPRLNLELPVAGAAEVPEGQFAVVEVERGAGGEPRGRLIEVLGDVATPGVDVAVVLRHYEIPERFPKEVLAAAASLPADPGPADWQGREDLRRQVVVTIDGEQARDFDDAVSIERRPDQTFRLGVHIADVAHYVTRDGALDREAFLRGTSVYYPERVIPMLPEALSNGLCSLRPGVPRLTLSAFLDVDRDGNVVAARFAETVIRSSRRLTYGEVRRLLEEERPGDAARYGPVLHALRDMHQLTLALHQARERRGSLDFDLPEGNVELDTDGTVVGVLPYERNVAHRLIEEFMIAANEAVARELVRRGSPALFRVHDPPGRERLLELAELLRPLGIALDPRGRRSRPAAAAGAGSPGGDEADLGDLPPMALQQVLKQIEGRPDEPFLSALVLRTLQRAVYSPECRGHYALASPYYTHFTSPIRRYPDLLVHRSLKDLLGGRDHPAPAAAAPKVPAAVTERLKEIADHASATERRAEQSERDLLQWKKVRFLADRAGERFRGRITGVQPFGLFVQLEDYRVDGLVPIRTLADDYYVFEPEAHRLVGERRGRVFQLADEVEVDLAGVDLRHRGLDLRIAGMRETPPRRAGGGRRAGGSPASGKAARDRPGSGRGARDLAGSGGAGGRGDRGGNGGSGTGGPDRGPGRRRPGSAR